MSNNNSAAPAGAAGGATTSSDRPPGEFDVLFGPGAPLREHPGNKRYREIINEYVDLYDETPRNDRSIISDRVTHLVADGGRVRYFIRDGRGGPWRLATAQEIRKTVMRSLRELRTVRQKKKNNQHQSPAPASSSQRPPRVPQPVVAVPSPGAVASLPMPSSLRQPSPVLQPNSIRGASPIVHSNSVRGASPIVQPSPTLQSSRPIQTPPPIPQMVSILSPPTPLTSQPQPQPPPPLQQQQQQSFDIPEPTPLRPSPFLISPFERPSHRHIITASTVPNEHTAPMQNPVFAQVFEPENRETDPEILEFVDDMEPIPLENLSGYLPEFDRTQLSKLLFNPNDTGPTTILEGFQASRNGILELQQMQQWALPDYAFEALDPTPIAERSPTPAPAPAPSSAPTLPPINNTNTPQPRLQPQPQLQQMELGLPPPVQGRLQDHGDSSDSSEGESMGSLDLRGMEHALDGLNENYDEV